MGVFPKFRKSLLFGITPYGFCAFIVFSAILGRWLLSGLFAMVSGILNCDRDFCDFGGREVFFDLSCCGFAWLKGVFSILG